MELANAAPQEEGPPWPKQVIVHASSHMYQFEQETDDLKIVPQDYREIVTQIIDLLLNFGPTAAQSFNRLPDFSRLVSHAREEYTPAEQMQLRKACVNLAYALNREVDILKGYRKTRQGGQEFPYYFAGFHNRDLLLDHMPF